MTLYVICRLIAASYISNINIWLIFVCWSISARELITVAVLKNIFSKEKFMWNNFGLRSLVSTGPINKLEIDMKFQIG